MRFTGPYAKINSKYCKRDQKVFEIFTDYFASLGEKMRNR